MFKKHCRVCGQIFCSKCSDHEIPSQLIYPNSTGNIRACTFCHSFVGEMETGNADIKHNTKSIKELMKRLSLSPSNFYYSKAFAPTLNNSNNETEPNTSMKASDSVQFNSSMENTQFLSLLSSATAPISSQSLATLDANSNGSSPANMANNLSSLAASGAALNNANSMSNNSMPSNVGSANTSPPTTAFSSGGEDNNPFDVTENRDFIKSQDVEIKQLIINVRFLKTEKKKWSSFLSHNCQKNLIVKSLRLSLFG